VQNNDRIDKLIATLEAATAEARELKGPPPDKLITAEDAAAKVNVPVKTIYNWARGKWWAMKPTRRTLRIKEAGFLAWFSGPRRGGSSRH